MSPLKILRVAVPTPIFKAFDYLPPQPPSEISNQAPRSSSLPEGTQGVARHSDDEAQNRNLKDDKGIRPGTRVLIPFGRRRCVGVLLSIEDQTDCPINRLKPVIEILDDEPVIHDDVFQLACWASDYYRYPIGEVLHQVLPTALRTLKSIPTGFQGATRRSRSRAKQYTDSPRLLPLNQEQQQAYESIKPSLGTFAVHLLAGVTGSGKTEVYFHLIAEILKHQQQVLVMVPEIGLTPQTVDRFSKSFDCEIVVMHSNLTPKVRLNTWQAARSGKARIVIGTRSAIFTPFNRLGLIIIDEEHDLSFKQQEGFRYSARDLSIIRAKIGSFPVLLGSATPSLESLYNAKRGRYQHLKLKQRATGATMPNYRIVDMREQKLHRGLSEAVLDGMTTHLQAGQQVLLFLNRRGYAPTMICHGCAWIANCKRCDARLILHNHPQHLKCHHCGFQKKVPPHCPSCASQSLYPMGIGTERVEQILSMRFPNHKVIRIDRDSTARKGQMQNYLEDIVSGDARVLIGTQMLAKGHHFPKVTLVVILNADSGLMSADYRGTERFAQTLLQVSGRAGRMCGAMPGEVLIQTHYPKHPALTELLKGGYFNFANHLLKEREQAALPPMCFEALIRAESKRAGCANDFLKQVQLLIKKTNKISILGPVSAPMARRAGHYRHQLLLQSRQRSALQSALAELTKQIKCIKTPQKVHWSLDVDPLELF